MGFKQLMPAALGAALWFSTWVSRSSLHWACPAANVASKTLNFSDFNDFNDFNDFTPNPIKIVREFDRSEGRPPDFFLLASQCLEFPDWLPLTQFRHSPLIELVKCRKEAASRSWGERVKDLWSGITKLSLGTEWASSANWGAGVRATSWASLGSGPMALASETEGKWWYFRNSQYSLQMSTDVYRCLQMSTDVYRCLQSIYDTSWYTKIHHTHPSTSGICPLPILPCHLAPWGAGSAKLMSSGPWPCHKLFSDLLAPVPAVSFRILSSLSHQHAVGAVGAVGALGLYQPCRMRANPNFEPKRHEKTQNLSSLYHKDSHII